MTAANRIVFHAVDDLGSVAYKQFLIFVVQSSIDMRSRKHSQYSEEIQPSLRRACHGTPSDMVLCGIPRETGSNYIYSKMSFLALFMPATLAQSVRHWGTGRTVGVRFPQETRDFSLFYTVTRSHSASYSMRIVGSLI
jgi:hypothetical protein